MLNEASLCGYRFSKYFKGAYSDPQPHPLIFSNLWRFRYLSHIYKALYMCVEFHAQTRCSLVMLVEI